MKVRSEGGIRDIKTVWMEDDVVKLIDQRLLPDELKFFEARNIEEVAFAIEDMVVRGAPAIGATAAYGMGLASVKGMNMEKAAARLRKTRPTANDLFYAIDSMLGAWKDGRDVRRAAEEYANEIARKCELIGRHGDELIEDGSRILTHCNAGALATVDFGTALAPIRVAHNAGKSLLVFVDETRPRLQGAKLTAWELAQEGIPHTIIADNAAGFFLNRGEIDLVVVGADRITSRGDVANKIGTYEKAVLAKENSVPFYVAAPTSTVDFSIDEGKDIPIEERDQNEVLEVGGVRVANAFSTARNPAFDVTPLRYISAFITEKGILKPHELHRIRDP